MSKQATQSNIKRTPRDLVVEFIVKGFGSGWLPKMPGTFGSIVGLIFVYFLSNIFYDFKIQIFIALIFSGLSWFLIHLYEKTSGQHDDSQVVLDEIVGIYICFIGIPLSLPVLLAGFIIFRTLDIAKPYPISWADQSVPGALGTLLDDLMAGVIGCVLLHFVVYWNWI